MKTGLDRERSEKLALEESLKAQKIKEREAWVASETEQCTRWVNYRQTIKKLEDSDRRKEANEQRVASEITELRAELVRERSERLALEKSLKGQKFLKDAKSEESEATERARSASMAALVAKLESQLEVEGRLRSAREERFREELEQQRLQLEEGQAAIVQLQQELQNRLMTSSVSAAWTSKAPQHKKGKPVQPSYVVNPSRPVETSASTPTTEEASQTWKAQRRAERNKKHRERQKARAG